jgi:hypothetical protein
MRSPFLSAILSGSLLISASAAGAQQPGPIPARDAAEVENSEELIDGVFMIVGIVVVLGLIAIFVLFDDDDEDVPTSP